MPPGVNVSGLESDGGDRFFCGGGRSGKLRCYHPALQGVSCQTIFEQEEAAMTMRRSIIPASILVVACLTLPSMQAQRQGAAAAPGSGQDVSQTPGARGGGRADAPTIGPGNL